MPRSRKNKRRKKRKPPPEAIIVSTVDVRGTPFTSTNKSLQHAQEGHGTGITVDLIKETVENADSIFRGHGPSDEVHERRQDAPELDSTQSYFRVISGEQDTAGPKSLSMKTAYFAAKSYGKRFTPDGTHPRRLWSRKKRK